MTLREIAIANAKLKTEPVTLGDGTVVEVRSLPLLQRGELLNEAVTVDEDETVKTDNVKLEAMLIIASVCDPETHQPLFTAADYDMILTFDAAYLTPATKVAQRLSGLGKAAAAIAEKNSGATTA